MLQFGKAKRLIIIIILTLYAEVRQTLAGFKVKKKKKKKRQIIFYSIVFYSTFQ